MKETILTFIAAEKLGLLTLETRNSDRLDFSEQSVWQLRAALEAAYEAGRKSAAVAPGRPRRYAATLNGKRTLVTIPEE